MAACCSPLVKEGQPGPCTPGALWQARGALAVLHSAGSGCSSPGSAECSGRSQRSAGTKRAFSADADTGSGEGGQEQARRSRAKDEGCCILSLTLCPDSLPEALPGSVCPCAGLPRVGVTCHSPSPCRPGTSSCSGNPSAYPCCERVWWGSSGKPAGLLQDSPAHCLHHSQSALQYLTCTPVSIPCPVPVTLQPV